MVDNYHFLVLPELLSAKQKIGEVASYNNSGKANFSGFKSEMSLEPYAFRQQLQKVFDVTLTDAELGSIITFFDKNNDGKIGLNEFHAEFFKLGKSRRETKIKKNDSQRRIQNEKVQKQKNNLLSTIIPQHSIVLPKTWTKEHEISAGEKILKAAINFSGKRYQVEVRKYGCFIILYVNDMYMLLSLFLLRNCILNSSSVAHISIVPLFSFIV